MSTCRSGLAWFATALLVMAAAAGPDRLAAQQFPPGRVTPDVSLEILHRAYTVRGSSADELLIQMRALGPPGLVAFPFWFEWSYRSEELMTALGRNRSGVCRVRELEVAFDVTAAYPTWDQPPDAPPDLVAAWQEFQGQITRRWEARRDGIVALGTEISRQVRRLEIPCPQMPARTREIVERLRDDSNDAARAAARAGESVVVEWPPASYRQVLAERQRAANAANVAVTAPPSDAPEAPSSPAATRVAPTTDAVPVPPGLYDALYEDLRRVGALRVVAGVQHQGEMRFLRAFGSDSVLSAVTPVELPAFTDVLVGSLAVALSRTGAISLEAPLSDYLDGLSPRLGAVTLEQLLGHRAGLDNARVLPQTPWEEVMDELDDRSLFTEPGAVHSYSMFGYPLAVRALEAATRTAFADLLREHVLVPRAMDSTSLVAATRGLPPARTSGLDLMRFASGWLEEGDAATTDGFGYPASSQPTPPERVYWGGLWFDQVADQRRAFLLCDARDAHAVVFEVLPRTGTAIVLMAQQWPTSTARFVVALVGRELGVGSEIFQPVSLVGDGRLDLPPSSCTPPRWNDQRVQDPGPPAEPGDWAGSYLNGDRRFLIEERDGQLVAIPFEQPLTLTHHSDDVYFVTMQGRPFFPISLVRDGAGRRYVRIDDRAYVHEGDRPPR